MLRTACRRYADMLNETQLASAARIHELLTQRDNLEATANHAKVQVLELEAKVVALGQEVGHSTHALHASHSCYYRIIGRSLPEAGLPQLYVQFPHSNFVFSTCVRRYSCDLNPLPSAAQCQRRTEQGTGRPGHRAAS